MTQPLRAAILVALVVLSAGCGSPPEATPTDTVVQVTLENGKVLEAEILLVAIGRGPVSADLGYEQVGVEMERGFVKVDAYCQTSVPTISAVGDLIPTLQLAHVGFAEGILVAERLAGLPVTPVDYDGVPRVTYSHPEVASVGLTTKVATERGYDVIEATYDLAGNGKARILGTAGAVKVIAQKDGPVLGVHMVGERVGELIAEAQLITNWEARPSEVAQLIHPAIGAHNAVDADLARQSTVHPKRAMNSAIGKNSGGQRLQEFDAPHAAVATVPTTRTARALTNFIALKPHRKSEFKHFGIRQARVGHMGLDYAGAVETTVWLTVRIKRRTCARAT